MKALVYHGPHQMQWQDWPDSAPGQGEVTVAVRAVGICGSDLHGYAGESGRRTPPMVMGHEATGQVVALGSGVPADWRDAQVIIQPFVACGSCDYCRAGAVNLCRNRRFYGGNAHGAMAERITLPVGNLVRVPPGLNPVHASLAEPLAVALRAAQQAGDLSGKRVLICGCGPIGLLALVAARRAGAERVLMTDIIERRRETALRMGADAALDPREANEREEVDVAMDAVGIPATFGQAVDAVRPGGTIVAIGGWQTVPVNLATVVSREITVRGSFNFTPDDFLTARDLLAQGAFDAGCLVTDVYPMSDGADVFASLARSQGDRIKVVLTLPEVSA